MVNQVEGSLQTCIQNMQQHLQPNLETTANQQLHGCIIRQRPWYVVIYDRNDQTPNNLICNYRYLAEGFVTIRWVVLMFFCLYVGECNFVRNCSFKVHIIYLCLYPSSANKKNSFCKMAFEGNKSTLSHLRTHCFAAEAPWALDNGNSASFVRILKILRTIWVLRLGCMIVK